MIIRTKFFLKKLDLVTTAHLFAKTKKILDIDRSKTGEKAVETQRALLESNMSDEATAGNQLLYRTAFSIGPSGHKCLAQMIS